MPPALFDIHSYAFGAHGVATAVVVAASILLGAVTLIHERNSGAGGAFATIALSLLAWMSGTAMQALAADPAVATFWARVATSGAMFTPAAALYFCATVAGRSDRLRWALHLCWALSGIFVVTTWAWPWHLTGVSQRWFGYYGHYGAVGVAAVVYAIVVVPLAIGVLRRAWREQAKGSIAARRMHLLTVGLAVASLGAIDFLPALGLPVYPGGYVFVAALAVIVAYVAHNYHLVDITPSLAGQKIIATMTDALVVTDDVGIVRVVNPAACRLLGAGEDVLVGEPFLPGQTLRKEDHFREALERGETLTDIETRFRRTNGELLTLNMSAAVLEGAAGRAIAVIHVFSDVTQRKRAEERIRFLAYNDALTKLPNRLRFDEQLGEMLHTHRDSGEPVTVLLLDIDRFKRINDTLGHDAGDDLLCAIANRLSCLQGSKDVVSLDNTKPMNGLLARLGGDEFALALDNVTQIMEVRRVAQRILDALTDPFTLETQDVFVSTSIGISQFPRDGDDVHTLVKNADTAMYHAKDAGRSNFKFFNESMSTVCVGRLDLEADLRRALERREFVLFYQPQVDIRSGRIFGVEALLRWEHPERGLVSPAEFIPLAEETGLIVRAGQWILKEACAQAQRWRDAGYVDFKVAVNLSERQFRQNTLVLAVSQALTQSGLDPSGLELELTEGTIMRNAEDTVFTLGELKAMGMTISVDDFGTGYSSLSYLKRFPIDIIKIDRSFVRDITEDPDDAAITASIIAMARSLKRDVIAEGVETLDQATALRNRGCHFMQGYLFGRPAPADEVTEMLARNAAEIAATKVVEIA